MDRDPPTRYGDGTALVVVVRDHPDPAARAEPVLTALRAAADRAPVAEVVVHSGRPVADGSTLDVGEDAGRGAAVNLAVAGLPADAGWVLVTDPDVIWPAGALDGLLAAAGRHPRAALLAPAGTPRGPLPTLCDLLLGTPPARTAASPGPVGWVSGRAVILRRSAWDSVDGYDPRHLGELGDVDVGDRLARAGWQVVHVPDVAVRDAGPVAERDPGDGILESPVRALSRYAGDRFGPVVRMAVAASAGTRAGRVPAPVQRPHPPGRHPSGTTAETVTTIEE